MTVVNIAVKNSIPPQAIHVDNETTNWDELYEFSWKEFATASGRRAGSYRLVSLTDDDSAEEQLGERLYAKLKRGVGVAAVFESYRWVPLELGNWLVKTHEDDLIVLTADQFKSTYAVLESAP